MMIGMKNLLGQRGSMMVEALAMLGLISMVTPMLYKKAAERTTELADINAASAVRTLSSAMETYIAANKSKIDALNLGDEGKVSIPIDEEDGVLPAFADYLPEGYMAASQAGRIFKGYKIAIRCKESDGKKSYTGMVALPTNLDAEKDKIRIAKIASMVGGNGGIVDTKYENDAIGVQGLWETKVDNFFDGDDATELKTNGTIVAATVSAVGAGGSGGGIGADENALYRKDVGDYEKNTMQVALRMNSNDILGVQDLYSAADKINIRKDDGTGESPLESNDGLLNVWGKVNIGELLAEGAAKITGALTIGEDGNEVLTADDNDGVKINRDLVTKGNVTFKDGNEPDNRVSTFSAEVESINLDAQLGINMKAQNVDLGAETGVIVKAENGYINLQSKEASIEMKDSGGMVLKGGADLGAEIDLGGTNADVYVKGTNDKKTFLVNDTFLVGKDLAMPFGLSNNDAVVVGGNFAVGENSGAVGGTTSIANQFVVAEGKIIAGVPTQFRDSVIMSADGTINGGAVNGDLYAHMKNITLKATNSFDWSSDGDITITANGTTDGTTGTLGLIGKEVNIRATEGNVDIDTADIGETAINIGKNADYINLKSKNTNVGGDASNPVLYVGSSNPDRTGHDGTVYIRRGVVEVASTRGNTIVNQTGSYVLADRLISESPEGKTGGVPKLYGEEHYDYYQVNPAYTSVMHDIKLTTRGGARLSDILPDFITKGIYVLDNTYKEEYNRTSNDWNNYVTYTPDTSQGGKSSVGVVGSTVKDAVAGDPTIPWLGFIPAPQCPPGYGKVVTLNPIRWRMAEMYRITDKATTEGIEPKDFARWAEESHYPAMFPQDVKLDGVPVEVNLTTGKGTLSGSVKIGEGNTDATPPTFQTNTWLNTTVAAGKDAKNFYGWHAIMGFLYNLPEWKDYLVAVGQSDLDWTASDVVNKFAWNLFPVRRSELMAIGHTYCYFDKRNVVDASVVDDDTPVFSTDGKTIDNIRIQDASTGRSGKSNNYLERLNDEGYKHLDW